jgi:calcineurin-like phosphoesterase family protein
MANTFLISDTHFGHANICKFLNSDGSKVRPWDHVEEMDETMIQNWNKVVKPEDKVYHLGDVVINRKYLKTLYRLNGDKVLIKGNHDIFHLSDYVDHFRDIRAYHVFGGEKMILSHIPIHVESLGRFHVNIHGHLHGNIVKDKFGKADHRYFSVCVEQINYAPIALEDVKKTLTDLGMYKKG